jgi:NDP-sugar pyrophosphorylase family protein
MVKPALIVLAAGIGSRYKGLKQIDPLGPHGELIIDYSVYDALQAGFAHIVFVTRDEIQRAFRQQIGAKVERRCQTTYVVQRLDDLPPGLQVPSGRQKPWGTAHATLSCRHVVDTPFAVINADDLYGYPAFQSLYNHLSHARDDDGVYDYCMMGFTLENTLTESGPVSRGICAVDGDGYLVRIQERSRVQRFGQVVKYKESGEHWVEIPGGSTVSMNMWGFTPSFLRELEMRFPQFLKESPDNTLHAEYGLPMVVGELVAEGRAAVKVLPAKGQWYGMTYKQDKAKVQRAIRDLIRQGHYPEKLWDGDA